MGSLFFPRHTNTFGGDFAPLFRMLDEGLRDVDRQISRHASVRAFAPRFDVNELQDQYELHGELPGIEQKNISIEFTDPHTLVIKGHTESSYESGDKSLLGNNQPTGRIEGDVESETSSKKATVEDEVEGGETAAAVTKTSDNNKEVTKPTETEQQPKYKSWVSERSVGEFHRSFSFPHRVDQDAVKASLKNGILSITVPKTKVSEARKINIE